MTENETTAPPARLRALLSWQANRVNVLGSRLTGTRMPATGRADFAVLAALEEYGPLSQADLGRQLGLDRNTINGIATRLDEAKHILRATDAADRRRNTVAITPLGQRYLDQLQTATDRVQAELAAPLSKAEAAQLQTLLGKILDTHPGLPS
ncbi:MarR family transcriptional regulator [Arthrobacter livingstonensis]|uniref:MarR family transcriptional regulator n=1 Tax=Arthrobacter livingstonensis TaxID=670078 RepID=A0A2V5LRH8_9MICC|nr:MarR family transcriptional regulator [Arthrobacter livingstonensis]PYI64146.1 MarR family transcriptional regulator [Arthrobacter livingstonensis]